MKRLILTLLAALVLVAPASSSQSSIVPLQTPGGSNFCTTFSINKKSHFYATAGHCVDPEDKELSQPMLFTQHAYIVDFDRDKDLAVLQGPVGVPALKIAKSPSLEGDPVSVTGYPWGWEKQMTFRGVLTGNWVKDKDGSFYSTFDLTAAPGNSGSPIMNKNGEVISVLQVGWTNAGALTGGPPFVTMRDFLEPYTEK